MASTRTVLRRGLSDISGDFVRDPDGAVPTCSAIGGAAGITAIDTLLTYYPDDYFNDWYFVLPVGPTGAGSYEVTRVTDFTGSTGSLILEPDASAQIASGQAYELHRYNPATKHLALNAARSSALDALWLPVLNETLVVDNLILNWDMELGTFTNWTAIGGATLTANTTHFIHGVQSANIAGAAGAGMEQDILVAVGGFGRIDQAAGKTLHVRAFLRATDASNIRSRVTFDGSTYTNGPYHSGDDDFEGHAIHYIDVTIPTGATEMTVSIEKSTAIAAQADVCVAWINNINRYTMPTAIHRWPSWVKQQANRDKPGPDGDYIPLNRANPAVSGRILRFEGKGLLTELTAETTSMEVSDPETMLLYAEALDYLMDNEMGGASAQQQAQLSMDKERWYRVAQRLRARGETERYMDVQQPDGTWDVIPSGETNYFYLRGR